MAEILSEFERVYVQRPEPPGKKEVDNILKIGSMIPVLNYTVYKNIPELLHESPKTAEEIASAIDVKASYINRLLRALSAIGYYSYESNSKRWSNTKSTELFLSSHKIIISLHDSPLSRFLRTVLPETLKHEGASIFESKGMTPPDFSNPELFKSFHIFMDAVTRVYLKRLEGHLEFPGYSSAIDIGGGQGSVVELLHSENPNMRIANFDLPNLREDCLKKLADSNLPDIEFIGGSFFDSIPEGYESIYSRMCCMTGPMKKPSKS
jgi:hypothetical protein